MHQVPFLSMRLTPLAARGAQTVSTRLAGESNQSFWCRWMVRGGRGEGGGGRGEGGVVNRGVGNHVLNSVCSLC